MPKIEGLDNAGIALGRVANILKSIGEGLGPEMGRRATSVEAVYSMLSGVGASLTAAGDELTKVAADLRNAAAELESLDET